VKHNLETPFYRRLELVASPCFQCITTISNRATVD
jgi:hypothetical protein